MKRLIPICAAVVALAGPLALADVAAAKDNQGGDRGGRSSDRGGGDRGGRGADQGGRGSRGADQGGRGSRGADQGDRGGRGADQGGRGGEYRRDRGADQGGRGGEYRGDRGAYERRGGDDRGVYRGPPPGSREDRGGQGRGDRRVYEPERPPPYYAPNARRGGYMPPQAGGAVPDYGRYRLRPPPRGFVWVRTANGYAMVSQDTGRVFDVVPY